MKIDFVKLLTSFGIKFFAGLSGIQAWLANILLNKIWKSAKVVWKDTMILLQDNKVLKEYLKEQNKPVEQIDKEKRKELEEDILTGK
jgi:hypothetical protein